MPWSLFFVLQELDSQIESLRDELRLAHTLADDRTAHLAARSADARRRADDIQSTLAERESRRAKTAAALPKPFLTQYERLRVRHRIRPWVVALTGTHCPACDLALPTGHLCNMREPTPCPGCRRLLIPPRR